MERQYTLGVVETRETIKGFMSKVNIMIDEWTSPNHRPIVGFVAQGVDYCGRVVEIVLGMKLVEGSPSGLTLCNLLILILDKFGINKHNIGYFQMDNALVNDVMVR